jgi:hypothetical protein
LKIIYCTPRSILKTMMAEELKECIALKLDRTNFCIVTRTSRNILISSFWLLAAPALSKQTTDRSLGILLAGPHPMFSLLISYSNSMAHEFYQILVGVPSMSLHSWKQLARWSIGYSCLLDREKARGHKILNRECHNFCQDIVNNYSVIMSENDGGDEVASKAKIIYLERRAVPAKR